MMKLLAVVKREYTQRVRAKMFIVTTVLLPVAIALFGLAPAIVLSIESGNPLRIVVMDETGKLFGRVKALLQNDDSSLATEENEATKRNPMEAAKQQDFILEEAPTAGRSQDEVKAELEGRLRAKEIDAYLILPADLFQTGKAQFFRRNTSDLFS